MKFYKCDNCSCQIRIKDRVVMYDNVLCPQKCWPRKWTETIDYTIEEGGIFFEEKEHGFCPHQKQAP